MSKGLSMRQSTLCLEKQKSVSVTGVRSSKGWWSEQKAVAK